MNKSISEIDSNFKTVALMEGEKVKFYNPKNKPFQIYGLCSPKKTKGYCRVPLNVAKTVSEGVCLLSRHTAGGRIRFSTNSSFVALKVFIKDSGAMPHMPLSGTMGFDLFVDEEKSSHFVGAFIPPSVLTNKYYEGIIRFETKKTRCLTLNFPLYNDVSEVYIGVESDCHVFGGKKYEDIKPVVYYGSSITQGACASRPGNSYQAIISRRLNCDYINLGFSGCGLAEKEICDYMATLNMGAFVCDYDHNAPNVKHLEDTLFPLYETIRNKHKNVPFIFVTRPNFHLENKDDVMRRSVVFSAWQKARNKGDMNVYFIDGSTLFGTKDQDCCTVDGTHPNDLGFMRMADAIGGIVEKGLELASL